jgi:predicted transcriptional regulator
MADSIFLPDAEFDVMQIVWGSEGPISSVQVFNLSAAEKKWKPQTVLTLLNRLEKRGFLSSEKRGKERFYWPLVARKEYLKRETGQFVQRFHKNSVTGLMSALFNGKKPGAAELDEIEAWLQEQERDRDV